MHHRFFLPSYRLVTVVLAACTGALGISCGARTGLLAPEADGGTSGPGAGLDAGPDVIVTPKDFCIPDGGLTTSKQPVFFEFVVDGSGSMDDGQKRPAVEAALKSVFTKIHDDRDASQGVGMIYFGPHISYPSPADVPLRFVDDAQLASLLVRVRNFPDGSTPTKEALTGGYSVLDTLKPQAPLPAAGQKVVVLVSDGVPDDTTGISDLVRSKRAQTDRILTFSVGIGDPENPGLGYDPKFMSDVAFLGGTARSGCDPSATDPQRYCHFQITPRSSDVTALAQALADAFSTIRASASECL